MSLCMSIIYTFTFRLQNKKSITSKLLRQYNSSTWICAVSIFKWTKITQNTHLMFIRPEWVEEICDSLSSHFHLYTHTHAHTPTVPFPQSYRIKCRFSRHQRNTEVIAKNLININQCNSVVVFTSLGGRRGILAATVPGRGKNWLMNKLANWYLSTRATVSSKSFTYAPTWVQSYHLTLSAGLCILVLVLLSELILPVLPR